MKYINKISIFILIIVVFITLGVISIEKQIQIIDTDKDVTTIYDMQHLKTIKIKYYEKLSDYCSHKINEIPITSMSLMKIDNFRIYDADNPNSELKELIEVEDGYLLAFKQKQDVIGFKEREFYNTYIKKIDLTGKELWKLTIDKALQKLTIDYFKVLPNRNIIISFTACELHEQLQKKSITCISQQGQVLWKQSFTETCGSVIKHILYTEKNELYCVGACNTKNPIESDQQYHRDIVLTKINNKGVIVKQRLFGGSNYDDVHCVEYNKQFGLVIAGATKSFDGEFIERIFKDTRDFVALFDSNLNTLWCRINMDKHNDDTNNKNIIVNNKIIYLTKYLFDDYTYHERIAMIKIYDKTGDRLYKQLTTTTQYDIFKKHTLLPNGWFIVANANRNSCCLLIYNDQGNYKTGYFLGHSPQDIIPTVDGGFILKSIREIKTLPFSCMRHDTETIIEKYNNEYKLEWRKSYDHYQDKLGTDFVLPLPSGKVIVQ
ncbi:hypothetical protein IMX26_16940 [Clostridium sp. 'deep sea']|uniref:hypothetical protein n=1 Tax=Clostridium sp. 'deep sea' TaxID=2779445 RepID=UPI001896962F|nr:hypothetical protein [Clostridium sp. 'deep sea']QOR35120.1 hypothetical protein IMX26_16940 [Clostridium sp. 'deep sea']